MWKLPLHICLITAKTNTSELYCDYFHKLKKQASQSAKKEQFYTILHSNLEREMDNEKETDLILKCKLQCIQCILSIYQLKETVVTFRCLHIYYTIHLDGAAYWFVRDSWLCPPQSL